MEDGGSTSSARLVMAAFCQGAAHHTPLTTHHSLFYHPPTCTNRDPTLQHPPSPPPTKKNTQVASGADSTSNAARPPPSFRLESGQSTGFRRPSTIQTKAHAYLTARYQRVKPDRRDLPWPSLLGNSWVYRNLLPMTPLVRSTGRQIYEVTGLDPRIRALTVSARYTPRWNLDGADVWNTLLRHADLPMASDSTTTERPLQVILLVVILSLSSCLTDADKCP